MTSLRSRAPLSPTARRTVERWVSEMVWEVVPLSNLEGRLGHLPPGSAVSVTCSPTKGVDATLDVCEQLVTLGHRAIPHLGARTVRSADHLDAVIERLDDLGLREAFVIAGDAPEPLGPFTDALALLEPLAASGVVDHVGVAAYPDGHPLIDRATLDHALLAKQEVLAAAGVAGHATTQLCFAPATIRSWLSGARADGLTLPVRLGIAGAVGRADLLAMGLRLGVGPSLRYLRKNRAAIGRLAGPNHEPDRLVRALAAAGDELGIAGLHTFTFNRIAPTANWRTAMIERHEMGRDR